MKRRLLLLLLSAMLLIFAGCGIVDDILDYNSYYDDISSTQKADVVDGLDSDERLHIRFIDVGQGDSSLIIFPNGRSMLIDTGEYYAKDAVLAAIKKEGLDKIDVLVATHPHSDHIGCMASIIENCKFTDIYMPNATSNSKSFEKLLDAIEDNGINAIEAKAGMTIDLDPSVKINILAPVSSEYDNTNNYSVVIRMTYGSVSALFMGDAEKLVEKEILKSGADVSANIIKLGHHGSSTSSSEEFIKAVSPQVAIASCGKDNSYGHPHKETIELMDKLGINMLRTYETGDIIMETDGKSMSFSENAALDNSSPKTTSAAKTEYVYVSKSGKYHKKSCTHYKSSFTKMTKEEAAAAGNQPCKSCNP